jgi:hypothetical protein
MDWLEAMQKDPAVKKIWISAKNHYKFKELYTRGTPDYDFLADDTL